MHDEQLIIPKKPSQNLTRDQYIVNSFNSESAIALMKSYFQDDQKKLDKFKQTMIMIAMDPNLRDCDPGSILKCGIQAIEIDLPIERALGQFYIVKYKGKATPNISYKGWQSLLDRDAKTIKSRIVYKTDHFEMFIKDHEETYQLIENFDERQSNIKWILDNLKGAIISIRDSRTGVVFNKFVPRDKLLYLRSLAPSINSEYSPWNKWPEEMFLAKAIKFVVSKTAMSPQIARAIEIENKIESEIKLLPQQKSFLECENIGGFICK